MAEKAQSCFGCYGILEASVGHRVLCGFLFFKPLDLKGQCQKRTGKTSREQSLNVLVVRTCFYPLITSNDSFNLTIVNAVCWAVCQPDFWSRGRLTL